MVEVEAEKIAKGYHPGATHPILLAETIKASNPLLRQRLVDLQIQREKLLSNDMLLEIMMIEKEDLNEKVIIECCSVEGYAQGRKSPPAHFSKTMKEMMKNGK
ncbi:MAG: hypothetical protein K9W42_13755 [Candidatus Heimdallarchaeota archaeon]|nr:hypothetical protein [Candidatus Heimdallarchaeota archaeon]